MSYSKEYIAVIVNVLAFLLPKMGIIIGSDSLTTTVTTIATLASGIYLLYKRYTRGGVNLLGFREN